MIVLCVFLRKNFGPSGSISNPFILEILSLSALCLLSILLSLSSKEGLSWSYLNPGRGDFAPWKCRRFFIKYLIESLQKSVCSNSSSHELILKEATDFQNTIIEEISKSSLVTKKEHRRTEWWTPELTELRRMARRLRRSYQRQANTANRETYYRKWRLVENEYRRILLKAKRESWIKYAEESIDRNV